MLNFETLHRAKGKNQQLSHFYATSSAIRGFIGSVNRLRVWILAAAVITAGLIYGVWLGRQATDEDTANQASAPVRKTAEPSHSPADPPRSHERVRQERKHPDMDAAAIGALIGQRTITFKDAESMERFLASMRGTGIALLGRSNALLTLRIGFLNADELAKLMDGSEEMGYIFPAQIPQKGEIQDGAVGFGINYLSWLGLGADRSGYGKGVTIAVLDTGVASSSAFTQTISQENLVSLPDDLTTQNGHGTAVASIIGSKIGIAPDSNILSYRVADDNGYSDTFKIAEAIVAATDAGAHIINLSLGSHSDSAILERAVLYAHEAGVVVVASAGNEGIGSVSYPAAYETVIGVGSVDALGSHLDFSNYGDVSLTAPGLALASAWPGDQVVQFTGTSASAPVVSGAISTVMSQFGVNAQTATEMLLQSSNEAGAPGGDAYYGTGMVDIGRTLNSKTAGLADVALASHYLSTSNGQTTVQVTVENRGTTTVVNSPVTVNTPNGVSQFNVNMLSPGDIRTFTVPISITGESVQIQSSVQLSSGSQDVNPGNNSRSDIVVTPTNP